MEELKLIRQIYLVLYNRDLLHLLSQKDNPFAWLIFEQANLLKERLKLGEEHSLDRVWTLISSLKSSAPALLWTLVLSSKFINSDLERAVSSKKVLNSNCYNGGRVDMSMAMCDAKTLYEAIESGKMHVRVALSWLSTREALGKSKQFFPPTNRSAAINS